MLLPFSPPSPGCYIQPHSISQSLEVSDWNVTLDRPFSGVPPGSQWLLVACKHDGFLTTEHKFRHISQTLWNGSNGSKKWYWCFIRAPHRQLQNSRNSNRRTEEMSQLKRHGSYIKPTAKIPPPTMMLCFLSFFLLNKNLATCMVIIRQSFFFCSNSLCHSLLHLPLGL